MVMSDADLNKMRENYSPTRVWRILDPKRMDYVYAITTDPSFVKTKRWFFFTTDLAEPVYESDFYDLRTYAEEFGSPWEEIPLSYCAGGLIVDPEEMDNLPFGTFVSNINANEDYLVKIKMGKMGEQDCWFRTGRGGLFYSEGIYRIGYRVVSDQLLID